MTEFMPDTGLQCPLCPLPRVLIAPTGIMELHAMIDHLWHVHQIRLTLHGAMELRVEWEKNRLRVEVPNR